MIWIKIMNDLKLMSSSRLLIGDSTKITHLISLEFAGKLNADETNFQMIKQSNGKL